MKEEDHKFYKEHSEYIKGYLIGQLHLADDSQVISAENMAKMINTLCYTLVEFGIVMSNMVKFEERVSFRSNYITHVTKCIDEGIDRSVKYQEEQMKNVD